MSAERLRADVFRLRRRKFAWAVLARASGRPLLIALLVGWPKAIQAARERVGTQTNATAADTGAFTTVWPAASGWPVELFLIAAVLAALAWLVYLLRRSRRPDPEWETAFPIPIDRQAAVVVMVFVDYAHSSGSLRWGLGLAFLGLLAVLVWHQVFRGTSEPAPLVPLASSEAYEPGELEVVAASVRRAARGLRYSQVLVTSRARAAFHEHARLSFGLTPAGMYAVQQEPDALLRVFGDPVLAEFLHVRAGDLDGRYAWVRRARERGGFTREFQDVLARMEAWR